ncbi:hypothetical protein H0H92_003967 [Tricholoma furcatifolium]|nr:hypothetical protein H0H92_003967 [Tricholoma furcatifolium]
MSPRDNLPRLDGTQLAATLAESLFYGVFFVFLIQCGEALLYRAKVRGESIFKPMPITAVVLFCTITAHWILDLILVFQAFILPLDSEYCMTPGSPNHAELVYLNLPDIKNVLTSAFYVLTTLIGDGFMAAGGWVTSCFLLTFLCNLYSTGLIAFKIFQTQRQFKKINMEFAFGMAKVMEILVESAVLYGLCITISLGTYVGNSNVQFAVVAINSPVIQQSTYGYNVSRAMRPMAVKVTTHIEGKVDCEPTGFGTPPLSPGVYSFRSMVTEKEEV